MNKLKIFALSFLLVPLCLHYALADRKTSRGAIGVIIDTGNATGGFNVSIGTSTTVLISDSGLNAGRVWRYRSFQVTDSTYDVFMGTYTPLTWGSGAGWFVAGSTGSWSTRNQAAYYGILDPSAGAGTCTIQGPFEYQAGEVPAN